MSNGKITTNDQKVNQKKYDNGYDSIKWGKKDEKSSDTKSAKSAKA